jgi:hypothetical protein
MYLVSKGGRDPEDTCACIDLLQKKLENRLGFSKFKTLSISVTVKGSTVVTVQPAILLRVSSFQFCYIRVRRKPEPENS